MNILKFKRVLVLVMMMAVTMTAVTGGTIAWFTDSVTSANNVIQAGNLDIELYKDSVADANKVDENTTVFTVPALWEPGAVSYQNLVIANTGNLHLNYRLGVNFSGENYVVDADGNQTQYDLTDVLKVAIVDGGVSGSREQVLAAAKNAGSFPMNSAITKAHLAPAGNTEFAGIDDKDTIGIVIYWEPGDQDNNWNVNNGKKTSDGKPMLDIDLGITLTATQKDAEVDAFGSDYDADSNANDFVNTDTPSKPSDWLDGAAAVVYGGNDPVNKTAISGEVVAKETVNTILFENAVIRDDTVITLDKPNTVGFNNVELIIPEGGFVVDNQSGDTTIQILMANTTINGVLVTNSNKANFAKYFKDINVDMISVYNDQYNWTNTKDIVVSSNIDNYYKEAGAINGGGKSIAFNQDVNMPGKTMAYVTTKTPTNVVSVIGANIVADNVLVTDIDNGATLLIENCAVTLPEGSKLVINKNASITHVNISNVAVNGVLLTNENAAKYVEGTDNVYVWNTQYNMHNTDVVVTEENLEDVMVTLPDEHFEGNPPKGVYVTGAVDKGTVLYAEESAEQIMVDGVTAKNVDDAAIVLGPNAGGGNVFIFDSEFTLDEGEKIFVNQGDLVTIFVGNVKVNGKYLDSSKDQSEVEKYFEGATSYVYAVVE